jgi:hypothetical protein
MRKVRESKFIALWSIGFFVFLQYGSATLSHYQPLPMQPRYVQPMIILLFIPLGQWLFDVARSAPFKRLGMLLLLTAVSIQGIIAADAISAKGLYFANFPRAVEQTLAMQATGAVGSVALPEVVNHRLSLDLRDRTNSWPKVDLSDGLTGGAFEQLQRGHIALLIPNDLARLSSTRATYHALTTWLDQRARGVPVEDGQTFLDRFFLATGIKVLQRRATSVVIARVYVFED